MKTAPFTSGRCERKSQATGVPRTLCPRPVKLALLLAMELTLFGHLT